MESLIKSQHAQQLAGHNSKTPATEMIPATKGLTMSSDENMMLKLIQHTHSPDAREVQVRGLLSLVEDILDRATLDSDDTNASVSIHHIHMSIFTLNSYHVIVIYYVD